MSAPLPDDVADSRQRDLRAAGTSPTPRESLAIRRDAVLDQVAQLIDIDSGSTVWRVTYVPHRKSG